MKRQLAAGLILVAGEAVLAAHLSAGGAWIPRPGSGEIQLGFSEKMAHTSFDTSGNLYTNGSPSNPSIHDFRYTYLYAELGVVPRLSARVLLTYLYGQEGTKGDLYTNHGLSDAWIGVKYGFQDGRTPMAVAVTVRTPYFYDIPGPYNRFLFDNKGNVVANSPEWRGLLKKDLTLSYLASHSLRNGKGWANLEVGYTWREGAPADQIPVAADAGYHLPFLGAWAQLSVAYVRSRYNESARQPDDRFGSGTTNDFNAASMARVGGAIGVPIGKRLSVQAGYNQWVWGRSARRYKEPYFSAGYQF